MTDIDKTRLVADAPMIAKYQSKTDRVIPLFELTRV